MFDYQTYFNAYLDAHGLTLHLSFDMPSGYEDANGTFDAETRTVYLNAARLQDAPCWEKLFYLFHELRHASQYLLPGACDEAILQSLPYVILYDGTCYKFLNGTYRMCQLEESPFPFADLYSGLPYELDANTFAYEQVKRLCGDCEGLQKLYRFWLPRQPIAREVYETVFAMIDEKLAP